MNFRYALYCLLALALPSSSASAEELTTPAGDDYQILAALDLTDVRGKQHHPFVNEDTKALVLLFVSTDCPVANAFQPYLQEFQDEYAKKGIRCFMVYCSPDLKREQIEEHIKNFSIRMPAVLDVKQQLARITGAKVTPEAIVIDRSGKVRYRGLINNLYAGYGKKRAKPTKYFLRKACDAVIEEKKVPNPETKPIGCFIYFEKEIISAKQLRSAPCQ